ncbi:MAG: MmcQ/YjbR family DNA-binding protein [Bacteroidota bacterium]|nr:MmcQ/YjbR family DNA-binding protein [Bacteroidota bacterium]
MDPQSLREMALDMPGTAERDHFGRPSYSVKRKIYMTHWTEDHRAVLKLTPDQQAALCEEMEMLSPVPNKWGKHGWTNVDLDPIDERRFKYLLDLAWRNVSPKWLIPTRMVPPKI